MSDLTLALTRQELGKDSRGWAEWKNIETAERWPAAQTALLICDMWDHHWSRGASERVDAMAPKVDAVVRAARDRGVTIVHAPSDTLGFYEDHPARRRIQKAPRIDPPEDLPHDNPPLPIDDSDGGSDTGETSWFTAWTRQHPAITIDPDRDVISDNGAEIWSYLYLLDIGRVLILGVHTNMCVLGRSFGIRQMVRWGMRVALVRDLTDTMYNPARSPYVSHDEGTRLVIGYIEKFWCPTIGSADIAGGE
ncbi:MAG TPA: isochorismatase [Armatimonadota bacterium]|nr:isochorismatase [Armatimonadota bacterium]